MCGSLMVVCLVLLAAACEQVPLEGSSVELDQQVGYGGWSESAGISAQTQQLADEVDGGDLAAAETPATDEAETVAGAASPITMTFTSPPMATTVTQAQVVPTVQEEVNRLEGIVTETENKQLDEEGSMKTFREQQLDKIAELKDKNAKLKRRSVFFFTCSRQGLAVLLNDSTALQQRYSLIFSCVLGCATAVL